jgi:hypothetical protein
VWAGLQLGVFLIVWMNSFGSCMRRGMIIKSFSRPVQLIFVSAVER